MNGTKWSIDLISDYLKIKGNTRVLSKEYTKAWDKYDFVCGCGEKFSHPWSYMLSKNIFTCTNCLYKKIGRKGKYTIKDVERTCSKNGFVILDMKDYSDVFSKIHVVDADGYRYYIPFVSIVKNINVNKYHKSNPYTMENIRIYMRNNNIDYELFDDISYVTNHTKLHFKCNKGHEFYMDQNSLGQGSRCPVCHIDGITKSDEEFKNELYDKYGDEYTSLDTYINNTTKILIKHNTCGKEFRTRPFSIIGRGDGCPYCNVSKGERKCKNWLEDNHFIYQQEYKFDDLVGKRNIRLRYDFAIFNSSNEIIALVEYDGEFHYRNVFSNGEGNLKLRQKYDKIKDDYASSHNIKMIRIPYWDFDNIEKILQSHLIQ